VISLQIIEHLNIILVFILYITTCIAHDGATRIWHATIHSSPHHHLCLARLPELRYISYIGFYIIFVDITIFSINDTFYGIQFFHSPDGHDGGSSSHRNELTLRDSSGHSNQPSDGNNTWAIWWLVWIVMRCDDLCELWCDVRTFVNCNVVWGLVWIFLWFLCDWLLV
jgi:hypothetical protein